jgi:eukaryotic-like serine/threonine-protein kinase
VVDAREYRIFISSPSDVWPERERLFRVITRIAGELGPVKLTAFRWEESYYSAAETFQDQIPPPSQSNLVICIFWKRLGSQLPDQYRRPDGSVPTGSEYEFEEAIIAAREYGAPDVLVYRKTAPVLFEYGQLDQETAQFTALQKFWQNWFQSESGHFTAGYHSFASTDEFEAQVESHIRQWLERQNAFSAGTSTWSVATKGSPFRGLEAFDEGHAAVFFGRTRVIEQLRERLIDAGTRGWPFLLVLGMSGAGKSSLVRAGLVPRLTQPGAVPGVDLWRRCVIRPSEAEQQPVLALARALYRPDVLPELAEGDNANAEDLAALLRSAPEAGAKAIARALQRCAQTVAEREKFDRAFEARLMLVVDQLEELFALPAEAGTAFVSALTSLIASGKVFIVCTMRSDLYASLQAVPALVALKEKGIAVDLLPPSAAEIEEIIRGPAQAAGLTYQRRADNGAGLDEELAQAASVPGSLPFLQFTLDELFNERDGPTLTIAAYDRLGGLGGAIDRRAEATFTALDEAAQAELPAVGREFVTLSQQDVPTGRTVARERLMSPAARARLVEAFIAARLFVTDVSGEQAVVRLAHDALMAHWGRARTLIAADREFLRTRARVEQSARQWLEENRDPEFLLPPGRPLAEAAEILAQRREALDDTIIAFIEASAAAETQRQERRRRRDEEQLRSKAEAALRLARRTRIAAAVVSVFLVLALAAAGYAIQQHGRARTQAQLAEKNFAAALASATTLIGGIQGRLGTGDLSARMARQILMAAEGTLGQLSSASSSAPEVGHQQIKLLVTASNALRALGDSAQALERAKHAEVLAEQLAEARPGDSQARHDLVISRAAHGDVLRVVGDLAGALSRYRAAMAIMQELAASEPEKTDWQIELSISHRRIADALSDRGAVGEALAEFRAALAVAERLLAKDAQSTALKSEVAVNAERIGTLQRRQGELDEAEMHYAANLAIYEELAASEPANVRWQRSIGVAHEKFGFLLRARGDVAGALREYRIWHTIIERVASKDPSNAGWQRDLADSHDDMADMLSAQREFEAALRDYRVALKIREQLVAKDAENSRWQSDLALSHDNIGKVRLAQGDAPEALREFRIALAGREKLAAKDPNNAGAQRDLASINAEIGAALIGQGQIESGLGAYQVALVILEALAAKEPGNAAVQRDLQALHRKIGQARAEPPVTGSGPKP